MAVCKPSGVCDPGDASSCSNDGFPPFFTAHPQISTKFLNDLAEVNPLLAGAVWAGLSEANSSHAGDMAEVKGTMGQEGRSYTYRVEVRLLAKGSASLIIHVQEDGVDQTQRYEGTLADAGRSGRFVQRGPKSRAPVFSWGAR